jgi:LemA protein
MTGLIIVLAIIAVLGMLLIGIYNRLVGLRQNCNQGFADIDAQLQQRNDLIPNLVETVKGYAGHEKSTLDAVIQARNHAADGNPAGEAELSRAVGSLLALAESYPDLKASANFQTLQHELADIEDKLAAARRAMNSAAADYNGAREAFPAVLFANAMGFKERAFMTIADADRASVGAAPSVKF